MPGQSIERLASGDIWRTYLRDTGETVELKAPIHFHDEFLDHETVWPTSPNAWKSTISGTSVTVGLLGTTTAVNGVAQFQLTDNNEDQKALVSFGGKYGFDCGNLTATKELQFETRVKLTDGGSTPKMNGVQVFAGLMTSVPLLTGIVGWEDASEAAGFLIGQDSEDNQNDRSIFTYSDDGSTMNNVDTLVDDVSGTWLHLRVDLSDKAGLRFWIDGVRVAGSQTFDFSAIANNQLQPVVGVMKHTTEADGSAPTLECDFVRVWGVR